ncbi:MAG: aspartoacylase [Gammaproteobacteria bacterium]|nr:aspartoacylase [Gammaproteobacteria bacterium]MDH5629355.1 aspartoacylase [Gammaproteobacteria bacterium]
MKKHNSVVIIGGTHGNEITGVHWLKNWPKNRSYNAFNDLTIETLLSNEAAIKQNKRYLDHDLNRCFKLTDLNDQSANSREQQLAKVINQKYGPKGNPKTDFMIDLHTSTANMQTNLVLIKLDDFHIKLAAFLKKQIPDLVVTSEANLMSDHHFVCSIANKSAVVEVGPVPQGALDGEVYSKTDKAVIKCLEFYQSYQKDGSLDIAEEFEVMSYYEKLYFPLDENGDIAATVHPDLIGKAYPKICSGDPIFRDFQGNDIVYQREDTHAAFINEAAYYDQKIALCLCNPIVYSSKTLKPVK